MKKIPHMMYLEEEISAQIKSIPRVLRTKFINDLLRDYFSKNEVINFAITVGKMEHEPVHSSLKSVGNIEQDKPNLNNEGTTSDVKPDEVAVTVKNPKSEDMF